MDILSIGTKVLLDLIPWSSPPAWKVGYVHEVHDLEESHSETVYSIYIPSLNSNIPFDDRKHPLYLDLRYFRGNQLIVESSKYSTLVKKAERLLNIDV